MAVSGAGEEISPLLAKDELIAIRYYVSEKIGQGSFGQVYRGVDKMRERAVAIKVEPLTKKGDKVNDPRRLVLEQNVLIALRNKPNIPLIYASGRTSKGYPYIIMQILGKNLTDLRKKRADKRFTPSTAFRVAEQISTALQHLHEATFIHRDVKPTNCCLGAVPDVKHVYLIDFGMCRRFRADNGKWRPLRKKAPFKGTIRYASLNALRLQECGPVDDLIGWLYSCIEITLSKLPWAKSTPREMLHMKENMTAEEVCAQMPPPFVECYNYISQLKSTEFSEHVKMHKWLRDCRPTSTETGDPFDWEAEHMI
uniref:non-specific serine/threonine protein kinase n=4 Tax=Parascaris univalens TaxID=6257 RepID=A0A914ZY42_PARUN